MEINTQTKPKVEVVFAPNGVEVVRLYGESWSDQPTAVTLFNRLAPLIRQIHRLLAEGEDTDQKLIN